MKKITLGYIFDEPCLTKDEKAFMNLARRKNMNIEMINISRFVDEDALEKIISKCDIFFNNSAEDFAFEIVKTIEELGKKVIDSSKEAYYDEDKWLFYLKCREYKIPTLNTILLSQNISTAKKELNKFGHWPVVLKRVEGTMGQYVDKADNADEAEKIINKFREKGIEKLPIIAQEFVRSPSYRVTMIGGKVVQTAIKNSNGWKATGVYLKDRNVKSFKVDAQLKKILGKISKVFRIKICGVDLFKKDGKWLVLEINSEPAFDFFEKERINLIGKVLDFLKKEARN